MFIQGIFASANIPDTLYVSYTCLDEKVPVSAPPIYESWSRLKRTYIKTAYEN